MKCIYNKCLRYITDDQNCESILIHRHSIPLTSAPTDRILILALYPNSWNVLLLAFKTDLRNLDDYKLAITTTTTTSCGRRKSSLKD